MVYNLIEDPLPQTKDKSHHVGSPPTSFLNPWPSFPSTHGSLGTILKTRFFDKKPPFVPVPSDRAGLVKVLDPDFSVPQGSSGFKVTWIGHASFLLQCFSDDETTRSLNILLDPVFSERTSPLTFIGPKRYTPTPCSLSQLLGQVPVDVVCVSHNHYDHADVNTLQAIHQHTASHGQHTLFCVALGNPRWLEQIGIPPDQIWESDWWERIEIPLPLATARTSSPYLKTASEETGTVGADTTEKISPRGISVRITCTPSQHQSSRSAFDKNNDLWCSWCLELTTSAIPAESDNSTANTTRANAQTILKSLFFAGDTGYRTVPATQPEAAAVSIEKLSVCPAFAQIGFDIGPFDLALLPIGLNRPRHFMSCVHANAQDSMDIHRDVKAKRSIGMHWGTVRGGLSAYYEDVTDPPREWEDEARKANKIWRDRRSKRNDNATDDATDDARELNENDGEWEIGLLDVGESVVI